MSTPKKRSKKTSLAVTRASISELGDIPGWSSNKRMVKVLAHQGGFYQCQVEGIKVMIPKNEVTFLPKDFFKVGISDVEIKQYTPATNAIDQ